MAFVLSSLAPECPGRKQSECAMLSSQDMLLDRVLASAGFIFFSDPRAAQVYYCVLLCNTREAGTIPQTIWMKRWNASSQKNALLFPSSLPKGKNMIFFVNLSQSFFLCLHWISFNWTYSWNSNIIVTWRNCSCYENSQHCRSMFYYKCKRH